MMKVGVFCGSFSPVHKGHIRIARACLEQKLVDEVLIIATGDYWDKHNSISLEDRIAMLEMVATPGITVDRRYNGYPYTYQIFEQLGKDRPDDEFALILGGDNVVNFDRWKNFEMLMGYDLIVVGRDENDRDVIDGFMRRYDKKNYQILNIENIDISSTYIREHIDDYEAIRDMIDEGVYGYMTKIRKSPATQHEITERHDLLDGNGHLIEIGYAKSLILDYDRKAIKANSLRIKEWDYYLIYNDDFAIALTVDDNSYMALDSISIIDFRERWEHTNSPMKAMTMGNRNFPKSSVAGDVKGEGKNYRIEFLHEDDSRVLNFFMKNFDGDKDIEGSITLYKEPDESMVIVTPYKESKVHFYYNQKINCMPAEGKIKYGDREYVFRKKDSMGTLDWGRGVWTYKNTWYWGSGSGTVDGHRFGFNIGYGFGDTSAASENMLFYDGKAHKLSRVTFNIPMKDGKEDYMSDWTFTSDDGRFEMDFTPVLDRASNTDFVILGSDQHQVFGRFTGTCILDDGTKIKIKDFMGFAEKVSNKW